MNVWRMKNGKYIKITDMTDRHLANAIAMLVKRNYVSSKTVATYVYGIEPRGECAQDAFYSEFDDVMSRKTHPLFDALEAEWERRQKASQVVEAQSKIAPDHKS